MSDAKPTEWKAGDVVDGKYLLVRPIARGGMGSVWEGQNRLTERRVAIKFMLPELVDAPATVERFFREAKASARIDHPSIVDVLDLGTLPSGAPYLVMEYLEGRSLEQIVETAPLAPIQAAALVLEVVRALVAAHAAGIVHRDLKPGNVFIAKKGETIVPKILDFGISKITSAIGDMRVTRTGAVLGSPAYMSPEQARGRTDIDGRADIWALGVILYEAVSNKLPFTGENYNQVMMAITLDEPTPLVKVAPAVDEEFLAIVDGCLQKDRERRPGNMEKLAQLLDRYVAPRAAFGIPPVDIGEHASDKRLSTYRIGTYAIPRAAPVSMPASKPRTPSIVTTVPGPKDVQVTVGAVTMTEPSRARSRRLPLVIGVAALLVAGVFGGLLVLRSGADKGADKAADKGADKGATEKAAAKPSAPASGSTAPGPAAGSTTASVVATVAPASSTSSPAASSTAGSSAAGGSSASAAPKPTAVATALPSASASKPVAPVVPTAVPSFKPKPKASDDGPANVGPGPGF